MDGVLWQPIATFDPPDLAPDTGILIGFQNGAPARPIPERAHYLPRDNSQGVMYHIKHRLPYWPLETSFSGSEPVPIETTFRVVAKLLTLISIASVISIKPKSQLR